MRKKKWFLWIIVILILGTGGFFGFNYWQSKSETEANSENQFQSVDLASVVEVELGNLKKTVSASGFLQPVNSVNLNLQSSGTAGGTVEETLVHNGEFVEEGQELVHLKDKEEKLNYLKAKNEYELAKINGSPSLTQEEKKLAMDLALEKLEAQTIRAPFPGKIINIYVEEGDYIEGTDDIIYLIDDSAYEIEVSVSEVDCMEVEVGQEAEVELDILDDSVFTGKVVEVADYATAESNVVTVPVTIRMNKVSPYFKPGFSASAEIIVGSAENVLLVPVTSLTTMGRGSVVLKVEGDKAVPTPVKTGISDSYYLEVTEGLQEGDKIIVNNYQMNTKVGSGGMPSSGGNKPPDMGAAMRMMRQ
ncbi:MAG: efflux RND transporter periplasmic adaptor subunit [Candidatus Cloacimonetes bacterium]|nr:efflux RND transporter periplasmic adaptor subunit [Candidatus Cloacimonadota bacterium]